MERRRGLSVLMATGSLIAILAVSSEAAPIYVGSGYSVDLATSSNVPTAVPGSAVKLVDFTAGTLDFSGDCAGCYNIGSYLNSGGSLLTTTYFNGADASTDLTQTLWVYSGTALWTNGQTYSVRHDDGVRLFVNGVSVFSDPLPTSPSTDLFVYSGATGAFPFTFLHGNSYAAEIDFQMELDDADSVPAPEPATLTLVGAGLLSAAARNRRRRRAR